jgi:hypothetical protein
MFFYLLIFISIGITFGLTYNNGKSVKLLAWMMAFLCLIVGISDMIGGYDRYIYSEVFDLIADVTKVKGNYYAEGCFDYFSGEYGWTYLNILISFITANRYIFIFIITIVIYSLLFVSIKRYTENYPFAVILFMGLWFFFSFTYLRQITGATIAWLGIKYVIDRKLWKFLLIVFIASTIHRSAIVFLPLYFIPIRKYDATVIIWIMIILFIFGLTNLPSVIFGMYGDVADIESRLATYQMEGSFRIDYVLEAVLFLYIILHNYDKIPEDKEQLVLVNMALLFCAILLFFTRSQNGGRMSWYYMLGIISTMCYLAIHGKKKISELATGLVILCFLLFFRILFMWGILLSPYKTFFTDGHRENDYIYTNFEYDENYDKDKFYR